MKTLLSLFLLYFIVLSIQAQNTADNLWTKSNNLKSASTDVLQRESKPSRFELYQLNLPLLKEKLKKAPSRGDSFSESNVILSFPNNDGILEDFQVMEASVMEPELQAKYPNIRSYIGKRIENPGSIIRFSVTPLGVNCLQLSNTESTILIDPYTKDRLSYMVYAQKDLPDLGISLENDVKVIDSNAYTNILKSAQTEGLIDGKLRTFRLALATTGEYSQAILKIQGIPENATDEEKKATVLSQLNILMTSVNAIFERDICITMKIATNDTSIIFLDSSTDNYTDFDQNKLILENQANCDNLIGTSNYDIGHVINAHDNGGFAGLNTVCLPGAKAMGRSGWYYQTIIHEMGHQFGAQHTGNLCGSDYYDGKNNMELGCGVSVMSIRTGVKQEMFFHSGSIQEIWKHITNGYGQCAILTETGNISPTISAGNDLTIPKSTPFVLEGQATDPNGNLIFSWEQIDSEMGVFPPNSQTIEGPAFKWLIPSSSPNRYLPELSTILSGNLISETEAIPSVARKLNFNFVVRDNDLRGGQVAIDKKVITVDGNSGPFVVTSHKTPEIWDAGTIQTITWEVAGTNSGEINTQLVDILFSADGGYTYPTKLVTNVPNDGSQDIVVPFGLKTKAATEMAPGFKADSIIESRGTGRYMIRAVDNIFFAVNSANLTIEESEYLLNFSDISPDVCLPVSSVTYDFTYNTYIGYTGITTFSANSPAGTSITFSPTSASTDGVPVKMTVSGITVSNLGRNSITVSATSNGTPAIVKTKNLILNVFNSNNTPLTLVSPEYDAVNVSPSVNFTWNPDINAKSYIIEIATDISFTNIIETAYASSNNYSSTSLNINTTYFWHVLAKNPCREGAFSSIFHFKTYDLSLLTYIPDDNFQKTLKKSGFDTGNINNYVLTSSIRNIDLLSIANQNITDLTGIQDFTGLINLICANNQLTIIDVTKNINLADLDCSNNKLTTLDVSNNLMLNGLYCSKNQLKSLDVSKNTKLRFLDFGSNKLASIDIEKNIKLYSLEFYMNNIKSLDVSKNSDLVNLRCNWNMISSLDLSKNANLEQMNCANNQLVYLNLRNGANNILSYAAMNSNQDLACIQVDNASLSMDYKNWLRDVTANYSEDCHYTYEPIMSDSLSLVALYNKCDGSNWIRKNNWLTGTFDTWEGVILERGRVSYLGLNSNGLKGQLPNELSNLTWLRGINLSNNQLTGSLPSGWSAFTTLFDVYLGSNQLTGSLPESWSALLNLRDLSMESNQLSGSLPESWAKLTKLEYINFESNQLTGSLPNSWSALVNLKRLNIGSNQISGSLPENWTNLVNMEELRLFNNQLTELPNLSSLTNLNYLLAQGNSFDFGDVEPNMSVLNFGYAPQALIGEAGTFIKSIGQELRITVTVSGKNNIYQWYKNGFSITGATGTELVIPSAKLGDAGIYNCQINNSVATQLTLVSQPITLQITNGINAVTDIIGIDGIKIYPNPTSGIFKIAGLKVNQKNMISIYTIDNRLIRKKISNSSTETINITDQASGTYLLVINEQSFKILKK